MIHQRFYQVIANRIKFIYFVLLNLYFVYDSHEILMRLWNFRLLFAERYYALENGTCFNANALHIYTLNKCIEFLLAFCIQATRIDFPEILSSESNETMKNTRLLNSSNMSYFQDDTLHRYNGCYER